MLRGTIAVLLLAAAAAPLPAEAPTARGGLATGADKSLRHLATGIRLPESLGGMARTIATGGGDPFVAIYAGRGPGAPGARWVSVSVGRVRIAPELRKMRQASRSDARRGRKLTIVSEGAFAWPDHRRARTFHGAYVVEGLRRDYWNAWDSGYGVTVLLTLPGGDVQGAENLGAAIESEIFGNR